MFGCIQGDGFDVQEFDGNGGAGCRGNGVGWLWSDGGALPGDLGSLEDGARGRPRGGGADRCLCCRDRPLIFTYFHLDLSEAQFIAL